MDSRVLPKWAELKIFRQITQLSKGAILTTVTDRVDSRVLSKWAELKKLPNIAGWASL